MKRVLLGLRHLPYLFFKSHLRKKFLDFAVKGRERLDLHCAGRLRSVDERREHEAHSSSRRRNLDEVAAVDFSCHKQIPRSENLRSHLLRRRRSKKIARRETSGTIWKMFSRVEDASRISTRVFNASNNESLI